LQSGCGYSDDGRCLEGLSNPLECPHLAPLSTMESTGQEDGERIDQPDKNTDAQEEDISTENWLLLTTGYELNLAAAARITSAHETRLVVLAGEPDAGKTTLIASLYEMLCKGPFASFRFAGSQTLLAFERACHLSRTSSEAETPDTDRTKGLHTRYFHLILQDLHRDDSDRHLLITDVSGEAYRRATDHSEDVKKLEYIKRADEFVLLLDGERLASPTDRQEAFRRGDMLLKALTEAAILNNRSAVTVAISKIDLLQPGFVDENAVEFVQYLKAEFEKFAKGKYRTFSIAEIASRPIPKRGIQYAHGLDNLIRDWLKQQSISVPSPYFKSFQLPQKSREADSYLWRHFA
jgi:hypothetical protein